MATAASWPSIFSDVLLAGLDRATAEFLMAVSTFERVSGEMCDDILDRTGSAALLEDLERRNLLVISLDDQSRVVSATSPVGGVPLDGVRAAFPGRGHATRETGERLVRGARRNQRCSHECCVGRRSRPRRTARARQFSTVFDLGTPCHRRTVAGVVRPRRDDRSTDAHGRRRLLEVDWWRGCGGCRVVVAHRRTRCGEASRSRARLEPRRSGSPCSARTSAGCRRRR